LGLYNKKGGQGVYCTEKAVPEGREARMGAVRLLTEVGNKTRSRMVVLDKDDFRERGKRKKARFRVRKFGGGKLHRYRGERLCFPGEVEKPPKNKVREEDEGRRWGG